MNLKQMIKQRVGNNKYPTLTRIKVGRVLSVIAAAPLGTSWMFVISIPMSNPLNFNTLVKSKVHDFNSWRSLR